ncbi:hypothetical protein KC946_03575 [Candidatus Saccharibacteria bacterium]|nr:hypothetical protein [Candidatus Saccharibacteria bacterium]
MKILQHMTLKKYMALMVVGLFAAIGASFLIFSQAATPNNANVASGTASLTLSPSSGSYNVGSNVAMAIYENSGSQEVSTIDVRITYDASKFDFVSVNNSGGAFDRIFENSGGNGKVSLVVSKFGSGTTGNQKVGNVTFKAKAAVSGSTIKFGTDSKIVTFAATPTNVWSGNTVGGSYTVKSSGGGTDPTPTPTPSSGGGSSGSSTPKTSTPSSGSGSSSNSGSSSSGSGSSAPSNAATPSTEPVTGSSQGGETESISIKVTDADGLAVAGATVVLKDVTAITDSNGIARYFGVTPGSYTISVTTDKGEVKKKITVKDTNGSTTPQEFDLAVKPKSPIIQYLIYAGIGVLALAGLTALYVMFNKLQKKARFRRTHGLDTKKAVVFDSKSSSKPTSPVAQGPMVNFDTKPSAPKPQPAAPKTPDPESKSEPTPGNVITPNGDSTK